MLTDTERPYCDRIEQALTVDFQKKIDRLFYRLIKDDDMKRLRWSGYRQPDHVVMCRVILRHLEHQKSEFLSLCRRGEIRQTRKRQRWFYALYYNALIDLAFFYQYPEDKRYLRDYRFTRSWLKVDTITSQGEISKLKALIKGE